MKRIVLLLVVGLFVRNAQACQCIPKYFNSLNDLKGYDFIALVKITDSRIYDNEAGGGMEKLGILTFKVIELFQGEMRETIFERNYGNTCDMWISTGQEWILFGKNYDGKLAINDCDYDEKYKDSDGVRQWKYGGFYILTKLQKLYGHVQPIADGQHKEFYEGGQLELEETISDGKKNGPRLIYYPSGTLYAREFYVNDSLDGKSEWYYPTGELENEIFSVRGKKPELPRPDTPVVFFCGINMNEKYSFLPFDSLKKLTAESLQFYFPDTCDCKIWYYDFYIIPRDTSKAWIYTESITGRWLSSYSISRLKKCKPGDWVYINYIRVGGNVKFTTFDGIAFPIKKTAKKEKR